MRGWIVTLLLVVGLPLFFAGLVFVPMALRAFHTHQALAHGLPAPAQVVDLTNTGNIINNLPVYRIALRVQPPGEAPFTAAVQRTLDGANVQAFLPGRTLNVKYNPRDHSEVAIVYGPG
jgi:hypothetical protein